VLFQKFSFSCSITAMKTIDVCGVGNALVDIIISVDDSFLAKRELEKATMRLVEADEQKSMLAQVGAHTPKQSCGGSVANTIYAVGALGGKTAFFASIGNDTYGSFYHDELQALGTTFGSKLKTGETTGTCLVMITPDAERTMRTCLAVSSEFGSQDIDESIIEKSRWCFIEGYLLANPGKVDAWLHPLIALCKKHDTKIAFTCSESWVVEHFSQSVRDVLAAASLVFANEAEAMTLTGGTDALSSLELLKGSYEYVVVTAGEHGAYVSHKGNVGHVPSVAKSVVDLNGAGDGLAGGVLYGLTHGKDIIAAAGLGCAVAAEVIGQTGPRIVDRPDFWRSLSL
jgi:sugar/nucleoside kinase (ribokinase family)